MHSASEAIMGRRVTLGRVLTLRLSARNELGVVEQIVSEVVAFLNDQARPGSSWLLVFNLCLRETIYNAVMHGNRARREAQIDVQVDYHPASGRVDLHVRDDGRGFDWRAALEAQGRQGIDRPRGRGLVILTEMTDEVAISAGEVRFTLTLPRDRGGAA